jgi:uroporphyrinogen decarboxylase
MTGEQWQKLKAVINGDGIEPLPVGFIIDSPWLPGWAGVSVIDYFSSDDVWFETNLKAVRAFPDVIFLPGFWAEFGMCTEPSAFGAKCSWQENELPFAHKVVTDIGCAYTIGKPDPAKDGLLPFVLNRLKRCRNRIEDEGHAIRFAVSRGPLNIASFLLGTTEFLTAIRTNPDESQALLTTVSEFVVDWLRLQKEMFPGIDGIFILDDIVGFLGEDDFRRFAKPYLERIFKSLDVTVRFFHNDAAGAVCAPHLAEIGVNLFNFSSEHTPAEMKRMTGKGVTLVGGIPPRDVLAVASAQQVKTAAKGVFESMEERRRIIASCGGGMPPGVSTENIRAFLEGVRSA